MSEASELDGAIELLPCPFCGGTTIQDYQRENQQLRDECANSKRIAAEAIKLAEESNDALKAERKMYEKASSEREQLRDDMKQVAEKARIIQLSIGSAHAAIMAKEILEIPSIQALKDQPK